MVMQNIFKNVRPSFLKSSISMAAIMACSGTVLAQDALFEAASNDVLAYDITEDLTTEVGPRQAGTEAEARGRIWAIERLKKEGFANVTLEEFEMPTWVRGHESASIISPYPQNLTLTALGNSASTSDEGIEAEVVYFPTLDDLRAVPDGSLQGKIAFINHSMIRTQDGSSYGYYGPARFVGPNIASQKGAAAMVLRSTGTANHRNPHTGNTNFEVGVKPIPSAALSLPDAENLVRIIERGQPVKMKLTLTPQNIGMQTSGNVYADVEGTNPELGMILIACHLDSWDLGTGAIDDAVGCGIITAAAKHIMNQGKTKRTIRIFWAGAEEVGIWGGRDYAARHAQKTNHALAMESDFGAGRVWRVDFALPESAKPLQDNIAKALRPLGIVASSLPAGGGADIGPIIRAQNLAIIDLQQDGLHYFDLHHTPDDTLDKVDKEDVKQNVAAWALTLRELANYEGKLDNK